MVVAVAALTSLVFVGAAIAAPADLDPAFNGNGRLTLAQGQLTEIQDVAVQPDGKLVLAGKVAGAQRDDFGVMRLNSDGSPDQGFGSGGVVDLPITQTFEGGTTPTTAIANAVALQPDGKIVLAGASANDAAGAQFDVAVARLDTKGAPDASFNPGAANNGNGPGTLTYGFGGAQTRDVGEDVAIAPDGKILVAGEGGANDDFIVSRLGTDGVPDDTFNGNTSTISVDFGGRDIADALALQPDGKVVLAGLTLATPASPTDTAVARVIPGQGPDPGFGTGGKRTFDIGGQDAARDVAVQPDGAIDLAGYGGAGEDFALTRLGTDGSTQPLNGQPTVFTDFGGNDTAYGIALQPNGKILLGGFDDKEEMAVARYQPDGVPDATFGSGGKATVPFPAGESAAFAVAVQPDGRIVLAGIDGLSGSHGLVARLLGGEVPGSSGNPSGSPTTGVGGSGGTGGTGGTGGGTGTPTCGGRVATIVGTNGNDKLKGTRHADVIVGLGGNDRINAVSNNDTVCGGPGNDRISGGTGNDRLYGEAGRDRVSGGNGQDVVSGGSGNDTLGGGSGLDVLRGGTGRDKLNGNAGRDKLSGGPGKDHCTGTRSDKKTSC